MNEENVKNKVIIPFLNSIGFKEANLSYEDSFTIKLGKNTVKKKDYISGRLDILVKIDNIPFLLWEMKKEGLQITDEEVGQAISYARLTEPITPYTIVSNGTNTQIYNTFNKKLINQDVLNKKYNTPNFNETINYRMDALSEIICYSKDNLISFLKNINNRELERVKGNKYIKELYVPRTEIHDLFNNFLDNDSKLFFITGESGIGKTNTMCNLLENNINKSMILFYNACFISNSIINQIMDDFNFGFDEQLFNRQLFNRINLLAKRENKYFIICIDAIDELAIQNPQIEIDKILNIVSEYSNIKVCLSCKDSFVKDFEEVNGISSKLKNISRIDSRLTDFNDKEKDEIIQNYKIYYDVSINENIIQNIKNYCNNGFLFRVIFETYRGKTINEEIEDISIIKKYIEIISQNYNLNFKDLIFSLTILGEVFSKEIDDWPRLLIEEEKIDNELRIKNSKVMLDTLVNINILQRYTTNETNYIDFNFKPLSYYAITILYGGLNIKRGKDFIEMLFELNNNRRSKESLRWYNNYIKNFQYSDIYKFKKEYGLMLINQYRKIVNKHFYSIRDKFELGEDINDVGIAIDNSSSCLVDIYGFYKKNNNNDDVRIIDFKEKDTLIKNGMYGYTSNMSKIDIPKIIKDKLQKIIENKCLNEENCKYLNIEYVLNMIFLYGKTYKLDYKYEKTNFIPNFNEFLPLNLMELSKKIIMFNIEQLKTIDVIDKSLNNEELYQQLITGKINIPECNYSINGKGRVPIYSLVNRITTLIDSFSISIIDKPHLIVPKDVSKAKNSSWVSDIIIETFTKEELQKYLEDLLSKYIDEYISIVESNFPTLKNKMPYYNLFKNGILIELYLYKKEKEFLGNYSRRLNYCYNDNNKKEIKVYLCKQEDVPKEPLRRWYSYSSGEVGSLFYDNYINNPSIRHMVLSNMIYELLESDIKRLFENEENAFDDSQDK